MTTNFTAQLADGSTLKLQEMTNVTSDSQSKFALVHFAQGTNAEKTHYECSAGNQENFDRLVAAYCVEHGVSVVL